MNKPFFACPRFSRLSVAACSLVFGLVATFPAAAHPGHGLHEESVTHALTSPYHLLTLALVGGGLLLAAKFVKRLTARRTLQITGVAAIAVASLTFVSQLLH
jgi:hypothetical protein